MKKSIFPIVAVVVLLSCSVTSYTHPIDMSIQLSTTQLDGNTLYVGGNGPGNYSQIQDAIDDASDGDTVHVFAGTYYEDIVVDKQILLRGENRENTSIIGSGDLEVVFILDDGITIENFTIRNGKEGILTGSNMHNSLIYNNIIKLCNRGINIRLSTHNTIHMNTIVDNDWGVVIETKSNNNIVSWNRIENHSGSGIYVEEYSGHNCIHNNSICYNNIGLWFGIMTRYNEIVHNNICYNRGLTWYSGGIRVYYDANNNYIYQNNFIRNLPHAKFVGSTGNVWDQNYWFPRRCPLINISSPFPIFGRIGRPRIIPWVDFDFNPAQEPYGFGGCV